MQTGSILYETGNEPTPCLVEIKVLPSQWNKEIKATFKGRDVKGVDQRETGRFIG